MLRGRIVLLTALAWLASALSASAGTFQVDSTADSPSANPGDGKCVSVAGGCTLRAAVQEANASTLASKIRIPSGTYVLSIPPEGVDFGRTGTLFLKGEVALSGADFSDTIIDGGGIDRVFQIEKGATISMTGLTVKNGVAKGGNGGGLLNRGHLRMTAMVFQGNRATTDPGQSDGRGAAFYNEGDARLVDVTFDGNEAAGRGGAICNVDGGRIDMTNGRLTGNQSFTDDGGGVWNGGEIALSLLVVRGNRAANGGGIENVEGKVKLFDVLLADNVAGSNGGGLRNSGAAKLTNVTVGGNQAGVSGGGIDNRAQGRLVMNNVTVAKNTAAKQSAGQGGGLQNASTATVEISNSILADNVAGSEKSDCQGSLQSGGYNLLGSETGCEIAGTQTGNVLNQSPELQDLAPNGGPAPSYALTEKSPAVDAGSPAAPTGRGGSCAVADQRGVKRPQAGRPDDSPRCDIGAYELKLGS